MTVKRIKSLEVIRPGSAPDIDTDFHTEGRERVVQYCSDTYGHNNVSNIITFGTFRTKNSLKSMATIYQIPFAEANRIVQLIPKPIDGKECTLDDIFNEDSPRYAEGEDFRRATDNDKWREVIKMARPLVGRIRETGIHACFEPGTLIKTKNGYKTIETIKQGEFVLTHKNEYKQVVRTMTNDSKNLYLLRAVNSIPTKVTSNHPFYTRSIIRGLQEKELSEPKWKAAEELDKNNDLIGIPINQESKIPKLNYDLQFDNPTFWWIVGRYLGDGWCEELMVHRNRMQKDETKYKYNSIERHVIISVGHDDPTKELLFDNISKLFKFRVRHERTIDKIYIKDSSTHDLFKYLKTFGKHALNKQVNDEVLNLPISLLKEFIMGYLSADGWLNKKNNHQTFSTTSKKLVLGMMTAINKVYKTHCNVICEKRNKMNIEGRTINRHDKYVVNFSYKSTNKTKTHSLYKDNYLWVGITDLQAINEHMTTYNLSVLDDNSYTANNLIVHNCGIIISKRDLSDTIPTQVRQKDGVLLTQWTYPYCEALGLIKMDFLGLDTLDIMDNTLKNIEIEGKKVPDMREIVHSGMDDPKTYKLLQNSETTGIFQLGGAGVRDLLKRVKPNKFEDIAAITALYRPGPMKMNSHIEYADRKNGREKITYIDPEFANGPVEDVLKNTYGLCVPGSTLIYDATKAQFVPIKKLNPLTSTTVSINLKTKKIEIKPIMHVFRTGEKRIIKIIREDGHIIRVAETHKILTHRGYIMAKDIKPSDELAVNRQEYPSLSNIDISKLHLAWLTGLYWHSGWNTNKEIQSIENFDNESLKGILAGFYSASGKINNVSNKAIINLLPETSRTITNIATILGIKYSLYRGFNQSVISIDLNDFMTKIAKYIPENIRPNAPKSFHQNEHEKDIDYVGINNINYDNKEMCYDIEVKDNHNYLIDNTIVHNCIYQEQCMQLATHAAGMSSYEADKLRKAIGKKKMKIMMQLRPKFIDGIKAHGYSENAANKLWDTIQQFGQYGFNKSHSISYAINAYKTCYLKANYPAEFMSALIQQYNEPDKIMTFLQEAKRMGLRVGPVDINASQAFVSPAKDKKKYDIIYGFSGIKQVSSDLSDSIIVDRKKKLYTSVADFTSRLSKQKKLNAQALKNLALAGAFDQFNVSRQAIVNKSSLLLKAAHTSNNSPTSLFDMLKGQENTLINSVDLSQPEYPYNKLIKLEADCIGIYISGSPTEHLGKLSHIYSPVKLSDILSGRTTGTFNVLGAFTNYDAKTKKNGARSIQVRIDDDSDFVDIFLPSKIVNSLDKGEEILRRKKLKSVGKEIKQGTSKRSMKVEQIMEDKTIDPLMPIIVNEPYCIKLKSTKGANGLRLTVIAFKRIITAYDGSIPFEINVPSDKKILSEIMFLFNQNKGDISVVAHVNNQIKLFKQKIALSQSFLESLEKIIGEDNILTKGV